MATKRKGKTRQEKPIDQVIFRAAEKIRQLKIDAETEKQIRKSMTTDMEYYTKYYMNQKDFFNWLSVNDKDLWDKLTEKRKMFAAKLKKRGRPKKQIGDIIIKL